MKLEMENLTIGADPELWLYNPKKKQHVSIIGKLGGTKHEPRAIGNGYFVQEDNCSIEYNIPPCKTVDEWVGHHKFMLGWLTNFAHQQDCVLSFAPSVTFSQEELNDRRAWEFGCEPDMNAWTLEKNPKPDLTEQTKFMRSAGGHIHIGMPSLSRIQKINVVRLLDERIGCILACMEPQNQRAELYGQPGAMREKDYGVEWRVPSAHWLTSTELMVAVFQNVYQTMKAFSLNAQVEPKFSHAEILKAFRDRNWDNPVIEEARFSGHWKQVKIDKKLAPRKAKSFKEIVNEEIVLRAQNWDDPFPVRWQGPGVAPEEEQF